MNGTCIELNFLNKTGKLSQFNNCIMILWTYEKKATLTKICSGIHACCRVPAQSQTASTLSWSSMYDTISTYQSRQDVGGESLTSETDYANMHPPVQPAFTNKTALIYSWNISLSLLSHFHFQLKIIIYIPFLLMQLWELISWRHKYKSE